MAKIDLLSTTAMENELVERVRQWFRRVSPQLDQGFPDEANLRVRFYFDESRRIVTLDEDLKRHETVKPVKV
jgi:hypothetical protein